MSWIILGVIVLLALATYKGTIDTVNNFRSDIVNATNETLSTYQKVKAIGETSIKSPAWLLVVALLLILLIFRR